MNVRRDSFQLGSFGNLVVIIALEAGKVVEEGSPKELLKDKESYFSKVYNLKP